MHQTKPVYSEEFCLTVIKQSDRKFSTLVTLAHQLGVSVKQVQQWCLELREQ
ncbi:hypothetical protein [Reinekea sp. G2M2-21]|uniref:hypothetical protein n=1 Tax=Reinekea sp. G2M2-21 TaxID=2788942 RepID=UPI0018A92788|nr:hypothetical protein [Reinekea sp. G2M2-21]MDX1472859.1 hypothetical protein [Reinekea sp.]